MSDLLPVMIGVDWGSTNLRAFAFASGGTVIASRGTRAAPQDGYASNLGALLGSWGDLDVPLVLCGMVGGRNGWAEAPYQSCPWKVADLLSPLTPVPGRAKSWILPGLRFQQEEVLRGEETQLLGATKDQDSGVFVLPGTHSKWISVSSGVVETFATFMTGELFALLQSNSSLSAFLSSRDRDREGFEEGIALAKAESSLLSALFRVRTRGLFEKLERGGLAFLSGLLIGAEVIAGLTRFPDARQITLICSQALAGPYSAAFARLGHPQIAYVEGEEAAARGLWKAGQSLLKDTDVTG